MAVVAEGDRRRVYLPPTDEHDAAADVERPDDVPDAASSSTGPRRLDVTRYGLTEFADLFTNRQLVALTTFSDLVGEARERVLERRARGRRCRRRPPRSRRHRRRGLRRRRRDLPRAWP